MSKEYYIYGTNRMGYMEDKMYMGKKMSGKNISGVIGMPTSVFSGFPNPFVFPGTTSVVPIYFGSKRYELSDWLGNVRVVVNDRKTPVNSGSVTVSYMPQTTSVTDYYSFGSSIGERSYDPVKPQYRFGFNNVEKISDLNENFYEFKFRNYDARLGRFWSVDPLFGKYPWNSPYVFAENRVIDGVDLEGREWENFMSKFKENGELKIKLPDIKTAQRQYYSVMVQNSYKSFNQIKEEFKEVPHKFLTNSKAFFNPPEDEESNPSTFKKGCFIKINIIGPMNDSYVKVVDIKESEKRFSATFVTLEGHIEKGIIIFSFSEDESGNIQFEISSLSEVDYGMVPNNYARQQQIQSWKEVQSNFVKYTGGREIKRKVEIKNPQEKKKK